MKILVACEESQEVCKAFRKMGHYALDENGKILSWSDPRTAKIRSKTFPGIAKAMAEQWGDI